MMKTKTTMKRMMKKAIARVPAYSQPSFSASTTLANPFCRLCVAAVTRVLFGLYEILSSHVYLCHVFHVWLSSLCAVVVAPLAVVVLVHSLLLLPLLQMLWRTLPPLGRLCVTVFCAKPCLSLGIIQGNILLYIYNIY